MTATAAERSFMRTLFGATVETMPDAYIDTLFDQAEAEYPGYPRNVVQYAATVIAYTVKITQAAAIEVDFEEGDASEKRSQVIKNLRVAQADWQAKIDREVKKRGSAKFLPMARSDAYKETPSDY